MIKLPISVCLFTTTKGHYGCTTLYQDTLNHLNRQIPLSQFGALVAHIKVSIGGESIGDSIESDLKGRGFLVLKTTGDWKRGESHQQEYLRDMNTIARNQTVQSQPYMLLLEDDSSFACHKTDLLDCLSRMIGVLENDMNVTSSRFLRSNDLFTTPMTGTEKDYFWAAHFNFQPAILRSRDFFLANKVLQNSWNEASKLHCETAMGLALNQLSYTDRNHMVWFPEYAEAYHIGIDNNTDIKKQIGL